MTGNARDGSTRLFGGDHTALVVATVSDDGAPHATRGWGITVDRDGRTARLLLPADDDVVLACARTPGARIAVTVGDVSTLHSVQLKGRCVGIEPTDDADITTAARYADEFAAAVERADGTPRALLERMVPVAYVACAITIDELYDQSPGPGAGAAVPR